MPNVAAREYRSFDGEFFDTTGLSFITEYEGNATLNKLINNADIYAGDEKKAVHSIVNRIYNSNIIDLEISFTTPYRGGANVDGAEAGGINSIEIENEIENDRIDRIDLAALEKKSESDIFVVFYEVKLFNDPRLKAAAGGAPEVVAQLRRYSEAIAIAKNDILKSYRRICSDLCALKRPLGRPGKINPLITRVADSPSILNVDPEPRLIIVDYSLDQWTGANWQPHLKKLRDALGKDRVKGWGQARQARLGPETRTGGR